MTITKLPNGNLKMSASSEMQKCIRRIGNLGTSKSEALFVFLHLQPLGYKDIKPEDCGALTSAQLITDGKDVWGFMDYQVTAFLEKLVAGEEIVWQKG